MGGHQLNPPKYGKAPLDQPILHGHIFKSQSCFTDLQNAKQTQDLVTFLNTMAVEISWSVENLFFEIRFYI